MIIMLFIYVEYISYIISFIQLDYIQTQISELVKKSVRYIFQLIYQECLQQFRSTLYNTNKSK
jgi:hypothetical protein